MKQRQHPITDLTGDHVASQVPGPTSPPTSRTIDIEATRAYGPTGSDRSGGSPQEIPGYELVRELGRGAFGVVYFGHAKSRPQTPLAIKAIEDQGDLDRLMVEPALLSRVKHPNVVGLENHFVHDGKLVLAMEYIPGGDLKALLDRGGPFTAEQVRDFLVQIGSALVEAHAQQIVHRDLKPSNVLVDSSAAQVRYVLADFGIGRTANGVQSEKHIGGTFLYMAPEQLRGRPNPQSDLWAIGVIAYQMLTGKLPFPGPSPHELARQIQYTDPPPPSAVTGQALPGQMEEAVLGLLRKSLSERTASAADLLVQLDARGAVQADVEPKQSANEKALPIAEKLRRAGRRSLIVLVATLVGYVVINDVIPGLMLLAGLWLFYYAQANVHRKGRRALLTTAAFLVWCTRPLAAFIPEVTNVLAFGMTGGEDRNNRVNLNVVQDRVGVPAQILIAILVVAVIALSILLPVIGSAAYANLRRARREQALLNAALTGQTGSDEFFNLMRDMLANRFEDVGFHLRYAELLYARSDYRGAAVEARLIAVQDPYHFDANLLLANAYFALGLNRDCHRVCDEYLAVTGYCFEFQELLEQCGEGSVPP